MMICILLYAIALMRLTKNRHNIAHGFAGLPV